jgi:hypothetical protein
VPYTGSASVELTAPRDLHCLARKFTAAHILLLRHILVIFSYIRDGYHVLILYCTKQVTNRNHSIKILAPSMVLPVDF